MLWTNTPWRNTENHRKIEEFLDRLVAEVPTLAIAMLRVQRFGRFSTWFIKPDSAATLSWRAADCGCLIGSAALCGLQNPAIRERVISFEPPQGQAHEVLYVAWRHEQGITPSGTRHKDGLFVIDDPFCDWLEAVGIAVGEESGLNEDLGDVASSVVSTALAVRHAVLSQYLHSAIRRRLKEAGYTHLPDEVVFTIDPTLFHC